MDSQFTGKGAGLTNLPRSPLPAHVMPNTPSQQAFLDGGVQVSTLVTVMGGVAVRGGIKSLGSQFSGNGAGLTNLPPSTLPVYVLTNHQSQQAFLDGSDERRDAAAVRARWAPDR